MMRPINVGKLALGGLIAGVVIALGDFAGNNFLLADPWERLAQVHNVEQSLMQGDTAFATFLVVDFILGFVLVTIYAGIRPRFGPGPSTAVTAAFLVFLISTVMLATFGGWFIPWDLFLKMSGLSLLTYIAAALAGGYLYSEADPDEIP
jgi:hypothetical protein